METQSAFMAAVGALVLAIATLATRRDRSALLYAGLSLAFAAWAGARGSMGLGWDPGFPVLSLALVGVGLASVALANDLSGERTLWLLPSSFGVIGLTLAGGSLWVGVDETYSLSVARTWAIMSVGFATYSLARVEPESDGSSPSATRLRYLAFAHGFTLVGVSWDLVAWQFGWARNGSLLAPLLYLYVGYFNLARVRVADIRELMASTITLALLAAGLAGAFAGLWFWVGQRLDLFLFNAFVTSFLVLLLIAPARSLMQRALDHYFVAGRLELERALWPLRDRLPQIITLDDLLRELLETLEGTERLRSSAVYLRDDPNVGFKQVGSIGLPPRRRVNLIRHPVFVRALEENRGLLLEEIDRGLEEQRGDQEPEALRAILQILRQLDAQLVLPIRNEVGLIGFWALSDEREVEPFSNSELDFLRETADAIGVVVGNSKTYERVRARDRVARLGEMAAGLAHEIRNPLATIRAAVAVLDAEDAAANGEFQEMMVEEIERLDRVVGTFLDYAQPGAAPSVILDLGGFVERACRENARGFAGAIELEFDTEKGLAAAANPDHLERVLSNVIANAHQALGNAGQIRIRVRKGEPDAELADCAEISIEDNGPGMDEDTLERAVVPFFTTRADGTGMGLALCARLVRAQGGSLQLRSRAGQGTNVVIRLPASPPTVNDEETHS